MKKYRQPKYILLAIFVIIAVILLRKEFSKEDEILKAGDQSEKMCPVHHIPLELGLSPILLQKIDTDSASLTFARQNFPFALDTFYIIEPLHGEQFEHVAKSEVWFCRECRMVKKKLNGQV
ncbi:MAG: hypothetical protein WCH46_01545 [bacterium]